MKTLKLRDEVIDWMFEKVDYDTSDTRLLLKLVRVHDKELACKLEDAMLSASLAGMENAFALGYRLGRNPDMLMLEDGDDDT